MRLKSIFISIIVFVITTGSVFTCFGDEADNNAVLGLPDFPQVSSPNVVLMDADSGEVLFSKNPESKVYPAGTTKLLTALLTIENRALTDNIIFSEAAAQSVKSGEINVGIVPGEEMTISQALYCMLLRSANDVAHGFAEEIGGTISNFAAMMNTRLEEIGAKNTHFTNPTGFADDFHYTTAYDMALVGKAFFDNKALMKIISYPDVYTIKPTNKSNFTRYYRHRYQMIGNGDYSYKYSLGGLTGSSKKAGECVVSFAQKDDIRLICVIMKGEEKTRYTDTIALFDYYFENFHKIFPSEYTAEYVDSSSNSSIGYNKTDYILIPKRIEYSDLTSIITYADDPVYSGKEGGFACISYFYDNINIGKATIFAKGDFPAKEASPYTYIKLSTFILIIVGSLAVIGLIVFLIIRKKRKYAARHRYGKSKLTF